MGRMMKALFSVVFAAVMWVQVPQWQPDWSQCAVDTPDVDCHWYVTAPDNTFGDGFSWENAPWFSAEGLRDVGELKDTMTALHRRASEDLGARNCNSKPKRRGQGTRARSTPKAIAMVLAPLG